MIRRLTAVVLVTAACGCSGTGTSNASGGKTSTVVVAASPPKDDGHAAKGSGGGGDDGHAAALEQLKIAPLRGRVDKQQSLRILLPDAEHWTRVKFMGMPSLVGFRYGKEHHAIVGGVVTHVDDNDAQGACGKSFEDWAMPWVQSFEVELTHEAPAAFVWNRPEDQSRRIVEIDSVFAKTATLAERESYAVSYAAYPAWKGACLILGVAVPSRADEARAREVRDRFARDVLPKVEVLTNKEPKEKY